MTTVPQEVEAAFMVCHDSPASVLDALWQLDSVGGYRLGEGTEQQIHDITFDTPERALGTRGYVLRVRRLPAGDLLTLKGESQASGWGGVQRLEIEGPATAATLGRIGDELARAGISFTAVAATAPSSDGLAMLKAWGLHVLHDRETQRRVRRLSGAGGVFGELALDRVRAWVGSRTVEFCEIELESKGAENALALRRVMDVLEAQFHGALQRWHYGKTATVFALIWLAQRGELEGVVDAGGRLSPSGCERLRHTLERGFA